jgi:chemotaxis signal transduction protein
VVCFRTAGAAYCLPVETTRAVRSSLGMVALPSARPGVVGLVPGIPTLTVIAPLGGSGGQIIVVEAGDATFGLLVDAVSGLRRVEDADVRHAPTGQDRPLICGTIDSQDGVILMADADALAERL